MEIRYDASALRAGIMELRKQLSPQQVNRVLVFGLRQTRPTLVRTLKGLTPRGTTKLNGGRRRLYNSIGSRIVTRGAPLPYISVGGRAGKGLRGSLFNFLGGTTQRRTKKGARRGRVSDHGIEQKMGALSNEHVRDTMFRNLAESVNKAAAEAQKRATRATRRARKR